MSLLTGYLLSVLAQKSILAQTSILAPPNGDITRRCLPKSHETIVPDISLMPIIIEENDWASHQLVSQIAAILIYEHLGYQVRFNVPAPSSLSRVFERASFPGERLKKSDLTDWAQGDGDQLKKVMESNKQFVYINMEVWSGTKTKELAKFVEKRGTAKIVGGIGYTGRDGWYVPRWIAERCGALAYPSWLPGLDGVVKQVYNHTGQLRHPVHATESKCYGNQTDCTLWFPDKSSTKEHIIVHIVPGYGGTVNHDMVFYNKMDIALQGWTYTDHFDYITSILATMEANPFCVGQGASAEASSPAIAFYHWEPSNAFTPAQWSKLERLMMPARDCDLLPRCDFPPNRLLKISSTKYETEAPLLNQLLKKLSLSRSDIDRILIELDTEKQNQKVTDAIFHVACGWVRDNQKSWEDWTIDRKFPHDVPFYAYVWNPLVFFLFFFFIVITMVIWCLGFESCFITGHPFRAGSGYNLGLIPACSLSKVLKKKKPPATWHNFQATQAIGGMADSIVIFASPLFYDDPIVSPGSFNIALLRVGMLDEEAAICIETTDCTARAGVNYRAVKCAVTFHPGEQIKWLAIPRIEEVDWMAETFFKVVITTVIKGNMALGGLSECTVVVTDRRLYPGLKDPVNLHTMRGRSIFVRGMVRQFLFAHGKEAELKRAGWILYEAIFGVIVRTWLYNNWLLGVVIGERMYHGLFLVLGLEAADAVLSRFSEWRQKITGTGDLRKQTHHHTIQKVVLPFTHNLSSNLDGMFVSTHLCAIDKGINAIYVSLYALYKGFLVIALSAGYILGTGAFEGLNYLLLIYRFVPLILMLPLCFFFGFGWKKGWRWRLQMHHEGTLQTRVNMAMWLMKVRTTMKVYGVGFLTTRYGEDFSKALNAEFKDAKLESLHDFDCGFLSSSFADFVILGVYITLTLVHMETRTYGAGGFSLFGLLATIRVYTMVKGAILAICVNCRNVEDGVASINLAREMLDMESKIDALREQLQQRLLRLHLDQSSKVAPRLPDVMSCSFYKCVVETEGKMCTFDGSVPLGEMYLLTSHASKVEQDMFINVLQGIVQPTNGYVDLPPFIRTIALFGEKMPELFSASAIDNALVFADRRKYGEVDAKAMLALFKCCEEGDQSEALDPETLSFEDSFLLGLVQALLADPEIIVFDKPLILLHVQRHRQVLKALVAWQRGGPRAVLQGDLFSVADIAAWSRDKFPRWYEPTGSVRRTLILNTHGAQAVTKAGKTVKGFEPRALDLIDGRLSVKRSEALVCQNWQRIVQLLLDTKALTLDHVVETVETQLVAKEGSASPSHGSLKIQSTNMTSASGLQGALLHMDASPEQVPEATTVIHNEPIRPVLEAQHANGAGAS